MSAPRIREEEPARDALAGARIILEQAGQPLHVNELTRRLLDSGQWRSEGKTPSATVGARLYMDIRKNGAASLFIQTGKATFAHWVTAPFGISPRRPSDGRRFRHGRRFPRFVRRHRTRGPCRHRRMAGASGGPPRTGAPDIACTCSAPTKVQTEAVTRATKRQSWSWRGDETQLLVAECSYETEPVA
jgi:hypothetical protein